MFGGTILSLVGIHLGMPGHAEAYCGVKCEWVDKASQVDSYLPLSSSQGFWEPNMTAAWLVCSFPFLSLQPVSQLAFHIVPCQHRASLSPPYAGTLNIQSGLALSTRTICVTVSYNKEVPTQGISGAPADGDLVIAQPGFNPGLTPQAWTFLPPLLTGLT